MEFKIHEVEWTDEKVSRFWDYFSANANWQYFTQQVGNKVIDITSKHININGDILDYGSGKGFLIDYLLKRNLGNINGCDFSPDSVNYVNEKFKNHSNFNICQLIDGLPSSLDAESFNVLFFLETIEHLLDSYFDSTLKEISRVIKSGGFVIITTCNEENLDKSKVVCPDCGGVFHRVQHVSNFSKTSIIELMSKYGFERVFCDSLDITRNILFLPTLLKLYRKLNKSEQFKNPNLIYIGKKK